MSRHRVSSALCPYVVHGKDSDYNIASDAGIDIIHSADNDMTDDDSYPNLRPVRPVEHTKLRASFISGESNVSYSYPEPGAFKLKCDSLAVINKQTEWIPTASDYSFDWESLYSDLVDLVELGFKPKAQAFVSLLEMGKTVEMVTNPFPSLIKGWRRIAGRQTAKQLHKTVRNLWLEARYGWRPLWNDLRNFSVAFDQCSEALYGSQDQGIKTLVSVKKEALCVPPPPTMSDSTWSDWTSNPTYWSSQAGGFIRTVAHQKKVVARVFARRDNSVYDMVDTTHRLLRSFGLSSKDLLPALWELVPWSFVVDWFINVRGLWNRRNRDLLVDGIDRLGWSYKSSLTYHAEFTYGVQWNGSTALWWREQPAFVGNEGCNSYYNRAPGLREVEFALLNEKFNSKGLNLFQYADLAMLIARPAH